ncbi:C6 zinc finger domain protein [Aspergillus sclerotiicarbonarius CBS 121057]|uniref:C6 zinc finger domain protein n=1 Tax=Aspergillus sclerotiicarbonarius (strain CBS 121057 / IBT 28362) TaxID=1448318 RepID=A0A319FA42_ASPSB|nr:C6 zinc finger domain protein [Aspergillus sclerotiicarbonarius CBS 121057]
MTERRVVPIAKGRQVKTPRKRSKTGCRTCRARRIKCDEAPGSCRNCTSTGRVCEGYDLHRLPIKRNQCPPIIGIGPGRSMTSDEKRGFSYFQHHLIPSLVVFFDSSLWQTSVLQMCSADPAVCHAVNMLSAIHQDAEAKGMRLAGVDLQNARHRFALEQETRSFALLRKRRASVDPQVRHVMLLCCLLFVMAELLLGQYANAFAHLRSGLRVLDESRRLGLPVARGLVNAFKMLDTQSTHVGVIESVVCIDEQDDQVPDAFTSLDDAREALGRVANGWIPFIAKCWRLSETELMGDYETLWLERRRLLSSFEQFRPLIHQFCERSYPKLRPKEQRGADLLRLQCLGMTIVLKTCLCDEDDPGPPTSEYIDLLSAHEAFMEKFPHRPTFSLEPGIIGGLYGVASKCPDLGVRCRAIKALRSWPRYEGMLNSNVAAAVAVEGLKVELRRLSGDVRDLDHSLDQRPDQSLLKALKSTEKAGDWALVRDVELR